MPPTIRSVFDVYELGEAIVLQLPLYDVLVATKVCKAWWEIISTSPAIRVRLLNERLPSFAPFKPGDPDSDDLCNASKDGPWMFRTPVPTGNVLVFKTCHFDIQLFVPDEVKLAIHGLNPRRTRGAFHVNDKIRRGWANFYSHSDTLVCRKTTSSSPWTRPAERSDSLWDFLRKFNEEENWRYRLWIEKVCERDDWEKLLEIRKDSGYWL